MSAASESNRVPQDSPAIRLIQIILAIALLGTLVVAGRRIYRTLPTASGAPGETLRSGVQQDLTIIFAPPFLPATPGSIFIRSTSRPPNEII